MAKIKDSPWNIEPFRRHHDRSTFDCGYPALNDWLMLRASQFLKKDLARIYVAVQPTQANVLGYYALSTNRVDFETLSQDQAKGLPRIDIPVILLGKLAVDKTVQGQGLGSHLLIDALFRSAQIAEHIGIRAVAVDAIDEKARNFYVHFGFTPLEDDPGHLFLPMHIIRKLDKD